MEEKTIDVHKNIFKMHGFVRGIKIVDFDGIEAAHVYLENIDETGGVNQFDIYYFGGVLPSLKTVLPGDFIRCSGKISNKTDKIYLEGKNFKTLIKKELDRRISLVGETVKKPDEEVISIEEARG
jgi:hypothetical protein